jgi:hypothetical protein
MSAIGGPNVVEDGLVLALDAANDKSYPGTGTVWTDLSGNGNNGTLVNGPTFNSDNLGSLVFDGINDFININQPAVSFSPNRWTICLWMKPNNQFSRFLTPNSNGIDQWLQYNNSFQRVDIRLAQSADTNERTRNGTSNTIPIGIWSYSCVSIDNLNVKIYANSLLTNEYNETISIGNWASTWRLGQRGNNTNWYSGSFSNLKVYNRALSAEEVLQNFNATKGRYGL